MNDNAQKKREARKGLINIAIVDAIVLAGVVAIFLATGNLIYLFGGLVGAALITGPMVVRWHGEYGGVLKSPPAGRDESGEGE